MFARSTQNPSFSFCLTKTNNIHYNKSYQGLINQVPILKTPTQLPHGRTKTPETDLHLTTNDFTLQLQQVPRDPPPPLATRTLHRTDHHPPMTPLGPNANTTGVAGSAERIRVGIVGPGQDNKKVRGQ